MFMSVARRYVVKPNRFVCLVCHTLPRCIANICLMDSIDVIDRNDDNVQLFSDVHSGESNK